MSNTALALIFMGISILSHIIYTKIVLKEIENVLMLYYCQLSRVIQQNLKLLLRIQKLEKSMESKTKKIESKKGND